jgi:hypothetical protein
MNFGNVVIIIRVSISIENLVMQATQPKERQNHARGEVV